MKAQTYKDVALSPMADQLHDPPTCYQVEHIAIGLDNPIEDIESLKSFFSNSMMVKIPRISSLLVKHPNGKQYWRKTNVDINNHFIIRHLLNDKSPGEKVESETEVEDLINDYIAELAFAPPMSTNKPLWEIHVLIDVRCLVLRIHHAIGDGASLMSLISEIGGLGDEKRRDKSKKITSKKEKWSWNKGEGTLGALMYVWYSTVFCAEFMMKSYLVKDKKTVLNEKRNKYVQYWPQKLATAMFKLDDVKLVKNAIPNATINDVLSGIIWGGFMKYIDAQGSIIEPKEGQKITGVLMANLRKLSGLQELSTMEASDLERWWGNKIGLFFLPIHYTKRVGDGLGYVRKAKSILDKKKNSVEPRFTIHLRNMILRLFGLKVLNNHMMKRANNITFGFSNVVGPSEQISIAGNPVTYLKFSVSSSPVGIMMHLLSYMKNLHLQILVAEDVIPNPKLLASCFIKTLQQMKDALKDASRV